MLVLTGLVAFLVNLLNANVLSNSQTTIAYDTQAAVDVIERDINISKTFLITKDSNFADATYGSDNAGGAWNDNSTAANPQPLILRMYATTTSVQNSNKAPVYVNLYGCTADLINSNPSLMVNVIYFVRSGNLYRRVLTDTSQATCSTPYQQQTCPTDGVAQNPAICKGNDALLLSNVTSFYHDFLNPNWSISAARSTQSDIDSILSVNVAIRVTQNINGDPYFHWSQIFAKKLN